MADAEASRTKRVIKQSALNGAFHPVDMDDFQQLLQQELNDGRTYFYALNDIDLGMRFHIPRQSRSITGCDPM